MVMAIQGVRPTKGTAKSNQQNNSPKNKTNQTTQSQAKKTQDKPEKMTDEQFRVAQDIVAVAGSAVENKTDPNNFESLITNYQESQKCSRGQAIKEMAIQYPNAHQNWLDSHQDSGKQQVQAEHSFWKAAQKMSAEQDISMGEAIKKTRIRH